jgi:hypothetical protein
MRSGASADHTMLRVEKEIGAPPRSGRADRKTREANQAISNKSRDFHRTAHELAP